MNILHRLFTCVLNKLGTVNLGDDDKNKEEFLYDTVDKIIRE